MYTGYSPHQMNMSRTNQNNFNNAYNQNQSLIPQQTYLNSNSVVHNNLPDNFFNEFTIDYTLHIDSADRDVSSYINPFSFVVSLGGAGTSTSKTYDPKINQFKKINYNGVPNPRIERNFINVKSVILDKIFLPRYIIYNRIVDGSGNVDYSGSIITSAYYRYLAVKIKELDNNRIFSTNNNIRDDSFVIYKDKELGGTSGEIWIASPCRRQYLKSALKNLDRLSIDLIDRTGNIVVPKYIDDVTGEYISVPDEDLSRDIFQYTIQFTVVCYENEMNTNVNYR